MSSIADNIRFIDRAEVEAEVDTQQNVSAWNPGETIPRTPSRTGISSAAQILRARHSPTLRAGFACGHPEGYTATDILRGYRRATVIMCCIRWLDAFGLPRTYAIETGNTPRYTEKNIGTFQKANQALGFSYDWTREVDPPDRKYSSGRSGSFSSFITPGQFRHQQGGANSVLFIPSNSRVNSKKREYRDNPLPIF